MTEEKRFLVALSFPGEYRGVVSQVAEVLAGELGKEKVFYDRFYEAELARPNMDTYLQNIYRNEAELLVLFIGEAYEKKEWCGLEWRAIRDLIKKKAESAIMPIRMEEGAVTGLFSIDGYVNGRGRTVEELAELILQRLSINQSANPNGAR